MVELNVSSIPDEIKKIPHWVNWTYGTNEKGEPTKIPLNPYTGGNAQSNNPKTWGPFEQALKRYQECENDHIQGIMFALNGNGLCGLDLDDCIDENGDIYPGAKDILLGANSYTEITPSGKGIRIFAKAELPAGRRKKGDFEVYNAGRFLTVTGNHVKGTPLAIEERSKEILEIHRQIFGTEEDTPKKENTSLAASPLPDDSELLSRAMNATNGGRFKKLWEGDFSDYPSQSEGDLALSSMLAFWTGRDPARIDTLFRQSGLMREKWNERHFGDGRTYGQHTIDEAIQRTTETYKGPQRQEENTTTKVENHELTYLNLDLPSSLEISQMEIKVEWIVDNLIPKESISLLHSIGGVGKSYLMFGMGQAVADGRSFFGLSVKQMPVFYIDFENPLPEISDRMKKIGGSENMRIWHLGHNPAPIRFDADEWEVYKSFPPGFFIIDSLRSSHLLEENSSKDASFIMARHKEIRSLGHTILLIHHENKLGGYRGSTAWFDLSDHILKFSRVKAIGSDEDVSDDDFDLPIRLGLGGKSRFSSAMDLKPMYFKFEDHQLCRADDPEDEILDKMADLLNPLTPPNQSEFRRLVKENLNFNRKAFDKLLRKGEQRNLWYSRQSGEKNKITYFRAQNGAF